MLFLYKFRLFFELIKKNPRINYKYFLKLNIYKIYLLRLLRLSGATAVSSSNAFRTNGGLPPLSIVD